MLELSTSIMLLKVLKFMYNQLNYLFALDDSKLSNIEDVLSSDNEPH